MKDKLRVGAQGEIRFKVEPTHVIDFATDGMPAVLCTPWLIWYLERAVRQAFLDVLEPGETTVGVHVDVKHLVPTPVGHEVACVARVIHVDGGLVSFQLEARDEHEVIARGHHKRHVIRVDRFAERVQRKTK